MEVFLAERTIFVLGPRETLLLREPPWRGVCDGAEEGRENVATLDTGALVVVSVVDAGSLVSGDTVPHTGTGRVVVVVRVWQCGLLRGGQVVVRVVEGGNLRVMDEVDRAAALTPPTVLF